MDSITETMLAWAAYTALAALPLAAAWLRRRKPARTVRRSAASAPQAAVKREARPAAPAAQPAGIDSAARRAALEKTLAAMDRPTEEPPTRPMARVDTEWPDTMPFTGSESGAYFAPTEPAPLDAVSR